MPTQRRNRSSGNFKFVLTSIQTKWWIRGHEVPIEKNSTLSVGERFFNTPSRFFFLPPSSRKYLRTISGRLKRKMPKSFLNNKKTCFHHQESAVRTKSFFLSFLRLRVLLVIAGYFIRTVVRLFFFSSRAEGGEKKNIIAGDPGGLYSRKKIVRDSEGPLGLIGRLHRG